MNILNNLKKAKIKFNNKFKINLRILVFYLQGLIIQKNYKLAHNFNKLF